MKANELMIGNTIKTIGAIVQVTGNLLRAFEDEKSYIKLYSGIPLTEQWLVKFGFENSKTHDKFFIKNTNIGISTADNIFRFITGNFVCQIVLREIKYVHQLQNLYFALTNEELIYKKQQT